MTVDITPPTGALGVRANTKITINFSEPVRYVDNSEITNANVANIITFKKDNDSGALVPFTAIITVDKKTINITPSTTLDDGQLYYISIGSVIEDSADLPLEPFTTTFTVAPDYNLDAMLEVRKLIWSDLVTLNVFDENDYVTSTGTKYNPIVPVQQSDSLSQLLSGKKHIVYDKIGMSYEDNWLICCEQVLFTMYTTKVGEINQFRNYMVDRFRRMDASARDLNDFTALSNKFKFYSIFVADISPTAPSKEMAGFFASDVILEIKYSRITDGSGRFI